MRAFLRQLQARRWSLQAKISSVLVAVIIPTFVIVTIAENQFTQSIIEAEIKQVGISAAKSLASEIISQRLLSLANPTPAIEDYMQELLYSQPNIIRMDVWVNDPATGAVKIVATNVEESSETPANPDEGEELNPPVIPPGGLKETVTTEYRPDELGVGAWEIYVPIERKTGDPRAPRKVLGNVHVLVSMKLVGRVVGALWKITAVAAVFSVVTLLLALTYFLRKTLANEKLLRQAETQNLQLTEQLHDAQRQLMNTEKLAVMGQLTASFAHEIGTPLNAIGGHLQILEEEITEGQTGTSTVVGERLGVIQGQLHKIEQIVKNFLQSTAKPISQTQLVDVNRIVEKTIGLVWPRLEAGQIEVRRELDREMGPLRVVPLEIEQILLNLVNNSLDSLKAKSLSREKSRQLLEVRTQVEKSEGKVWAAVSVYDTGEGIRKTDLANVLKPFFTTKRPGEGTGLGLTISRELAQKYGGMLDIDSKEGAWTRVTLRIPYQV